MFLWVLAVKWLPLFDCPKLKCVPNYAIYLQFLNAGCWERKCNYGLQGMMLLLPARWHLKESVPDHPNAKKSSLHRIGLQYLT